MNNYCDELHKILQNATRFTFPFDDENIPNNGIYVIYEKKEIGHGGDRIVRVGTHTGVNQLLPRLKQHFINEKKDRSIFRKHIGRAMLSRSNDSFIKQWEWDLTTRKNKDKYLKILDVEKQNEIEHKVSTYIQNNLSFVVFEVNDKEERLYLESRIISTVSLCKECVCSNTWLGNYSPKLRIRESSLWLINELYKTPLNQDDINTIKELCSIQQS